MELRLRGGSEGSHLVWNFHYLSYNILRNTKNLVGKCASSEASVLSSKNSDITYFTELFQDSGAMNTKSDKLYVTNILAIVKTCSCLGRGWTYPFNNLIRIDQKCP